MHKGKHTRAPAQMLDHDLGEAEEQHQQAARAHLVTLDQARPPGRTRARSDPSEARPARSGGRRAWPTAAGASRLSPADWGSSSVGLCAL
jgi:hypothetical protein